MSIPSIDAYSQEASRKFSRRISLRLSLVFVLAYGYFLYIDIVKTTASSVESSRLFISQSIKLGDRFALDAHLKSLTEKEFASAFLYYRSDENDKKSTLIVRADEIEASPNSFAFVRGRFCFISDHHISDSLSREFRLKLAKPLDLWMPIIWFSLLVIGIFSIGRFSSRTFRSLAGAYNFSISFLVVTVNSFEGIDTDSVDKNKLAFKEVVQLFDVFRLQWQKIKANEIEIIKLVKERAVAHMAQMLTHDMRAPLGTFERLLLAADAELATMRPAVRDSLNRLYAMVDALRYSETENFVRRTVCSIDFAFGIEMLQTKTERLGLEITHPSLPIVDAFVDSPKLERSWINLAANALEFAQTFVKIEAMTAGSDLIIRVIDDGPGVPDDFLPKLFQRGATHGKHDGTGLGLAFVRQIMLGHGGDVTYYRKNGLTIFECRLPDALQIKKEREVDQTETLRNYSKSPLVLQKVAICLKPVALSKTIINAMIFPKSDKFTFTEEHYGADIVVSNIDAIMFEVLERDDQEFIQVSANWGNEFGIIERLKIKLCF